MNRLANRIASVEKQARIIDKRRPSSPAELRRDWEHLAAKHGMTLDESLDRHGTFAAFCHWALMQVGRDELKAPDNGLNPMDQYMRMIRQ
jgi:hypothetical protein